MSGRKVVPLSMVRDVDEEEERFREMKENAIVARHVSSGMSVGGGEDDENIQRRRSSSGRHIKQQALLSPSAIPKMVPRITKFLAKTEGVLRPGSGSDSEGEEASKSDVDEARRAATRKRKKKKKLGRRFSTGALLAEPGFADQQRPVFLIHPQSPYRVCWDILTMLMLFYVAIMTPIRIGFEEDAEGFMRDFELLIDVLFCVDVALNFRTSYINEDGTEETRAWPVAKSYLKGFFLIDFVSSVPFDHIMTNQEDLGNLQASKTLKAGRILKVSRVLKIAKLLRLFRMAKVVERMDDYITLGRNTTKLLKLLGITCLMAHLNACGWSFMSRVTDQFYEISWQRHYNGGYLLDEQDIGPEYIVSLMWTVMTMTTVGYGDVLPQNDAERIYEIYMMVISCGFYGFILGSMASLVASLDAHSRQYHERMDDIASYMKLRNFPQTLTRRVRRYFKHYFDRKTALNERRILDELSASLRVEVSKFLIDSLFRPVSILDSLPLDMQARLFASLKPEQVGLGEIMHNVGDTGREMYIVVHGRVIMVDENDHKIVYEKYGSQSYFGELYAFGLATFWDVQVVAQTNVEVYSLSASDIKDVFMHAPTLMEDVHEKILMRYHDMLDTLMAEDVGGSDGSALSTGESIGDAQSDGSAKRRRSKSPATTPTSLMRRLSSSVGVNVKIEDPETLLRKMKVQKKKRTRLRRIVKGLLDLFEVRDQNLSDSQSDVTTLDSRRNSRVADEGGNTQQRRTSKMSSKSESSTESSSPPTVFDPRQKDRLLAGPRLTLIPSDASMGGGPIDNVLHRRRRSSITNRIEKMIQKKKSKRDVPIGIPVVQRQQSNDSSSSHDEHRSKSGTIDIVGDNIRRTFSSHHQLKRPSSAESVSRRVERRVMERVDRRLERIEAMLRRVNGDGSTPTDTRGFDEDGDIDI